MLERLYRCCEFAPIFVPSSSASFNLLHRLDGQTWLSCVGSNGTIPWTASIPCPSSFARSTTGRLFLIASLVLQGHDKTGGRAVRIICLSLAKLACYRGCSDRDFILHHSESPLGPFPIYLNTSTTQTPFTTPSPTSLPTNPSLKYATSTLPISASNLIARIGTTNQPSISLFHSLGFTTVKIVEVFQESELRYTSSSSPWQEIDLTDKIGRYDP